MNRDPNLRRTPMNRLRSLMAGLAVLLLLGLTAGPAIAPAGASSPNLEISVDVGIPPPLPPSGSGTVDWIDGRLGTVTCTGEYTKVPEESNLLGIIDAFLNGDGTAPRTDDAPAFCPPCAIIAIVIGLAGLTVGLINLYRSLQDDPEWTYKQSATCTAAGYSAWATGSGGLARRVTLHDQDKPEASCEYDGLMDWWPVFSTACRADFSTDAPLTWTKSWVDDIVYDTAQPCFHPSVHATNSPQVEQLGGVLGFDDKNLRFFHPDGKCVGDVDVCFTQDETCGQVW